MNTGGPIIFWDVDTQIDFLFPEGRLYVPGGEQIIPNLHRLTSFARDRKIPLISTACAHPPGDPEFDVYGEHCVVGTPGQQKVAETLLPRRLIVPYREFKLPADLSDYDQVIVEKEKLDVFTNPNTDDLLRLFPASAGVVVYGVVTEICVAYAASGLLDREYRIRLVEDAIRALDDPKSCTFLEHARDRGAKLVSTEEVLGR